VSRARHVAAVALAGGLVGALALGCQNDLPGDVVGTFKISVALRQNDCGPSAVYTNDGRKYVVELREGPDLAKQRGYWHVPKTHPLPGALSGDTFRFAYDALVASTPGDAGPGACALTQGEVLEGRFVRADAGSADAGEAAGDAEPDDAGDEVGDAERDDSGTGSTDAALGHDLEATHTLTITPASGTSCASAIAPTGPFAKLPCTIVYDLTGTARGPL